MDLLLALEILNGNLVRVCDSIVPVEEVKYNAPVRVLRLTSYPYDVSYSCDRISGLVTAHNLSEYVNHVEAFDIEDAYDSCMLTIMREVSKACSEDFQFLGIE